MATRRDILKATATCVTAFAIPASGFSRSRLSKGRIDFQSFMPDYFDGKPYGPEELMDSGNEAGIDSFIVFPEITLKPDNRGLVKRIRSNPGMIGCASINATLGAEALKEFEISVKEFGFKSVRLSPVIHRYAIDEEIVHPFLEAARKFDVPVTVDGDSSVCSPAQIGRVAERFPGVPIIVDLGFRPRVAPPGRPAGGRDMVNAIEKCPNIYLGITALTASEPHIVKSAVTTAGPERVVFGTNAPSGIPLFAVEGIKLAGLGEEAEELIFRENIRKIYKID